MISVIMVITKGAKNPKRNDETTLKNISCEEFYEIERAD
jgi:hypothetical protein